MSYEAILVTPFKPESLAEWCHKYVITGVSEDCPCGQAAFVCPLFGKTEHRCGEITPEDWLTVLRGGGRR